MLHGVVERCEVGSECQNCRAKKYCRTLCDISDALLLNGVNHLRNEERCRRKDEVVGYLRVVCTHLESGKKCCQSTSKPHILAQGVVNCAEHCRGVYQGPHLGDVTSSDNQEEVGRKSVGQADNEANPR